LKARRPTRTIGEMNSEDAMDDVSILLIAKKAGYGLAPRKWRATLKQIRSLPESQVRPAA
jgi:uncharacterized protein YjeT (DUF2065 family)